MVDISFTMVFQWINFAILLFLLSKLLFRPITEFLDKRRQDIEDDIEEGKKTREEADSVLSSYQEKLEGADREAMEVKFEAHNEGLKEREKIIRRAEDDAMKILNRAQDEIRLEEKRAR